MIKTVIIAAIGQNGVMGSGNDLPWRIPADLKHFKATTLGHPMVLGAKTWDSFGRKPLPGRLHVIISSSMRNVNLMGHYPNMSASSDLALGISMAKSEAKRLGKDRIYIVGGGQIYRQTIDQADEMIITHVEAAPDGDVFFPEFGDEWVGETLSTDSSNGFDYSIVRYRRA